MVYRCWASFRYRLYRAKRIRTASTPTSQKTALDIQITNVYPEYFNSGAYTTRLTNDHFIN